MKRIDTTINPYIYPNTFLRELGSNFGQYPFMVFASEFYNSNLGLTSSDVINKIEVEITLNNQTFFPFIAIGDYNNVYKTINYNIEQISGNPDTYNYVSHGEATFHHNTYYIKNREGVPRSFRITITPIGTFSNNDIIFIGSVFRNSVENLEHKYPLGSKVKFYTTNDKVVERELYTQNKRVMDYRFFLAGYYGGLHIDSFTGIKNSSSENTITYLYGSNDIPIFTHRENIFSSYIYNGSFGGYQYLFRGDAGGNKGNYLITFNNSTNFILLVRNGNIEIVIYRNNNVMSLFINGEEKTLVAPFLTPNFAQDIMVNQENYPLENSVGYLNKDGSVYWFNNIHATPSVEGASVKNSRLCRGGDYFKVHTGTTLPLLVYTK